jgi:hypothetical protein
MTAFFDRSDHKERKRIAEKKNDNEKRINFYLKNLFLAFVFSVPFHAISAFKFCLVCCSKIGYNINRTLLRTGASQ